ncbi:hypothetical protein GCM10009555_052710 [Acrocarpospora macrocephala]|uniref:Lipoprotein n=2 Tax=Acrocarpospora macrocephala TaxID=150177 RepID=A0A5M3X703_9ACTN|nr:hypothetical protein Amac_095370 [Acrocarpospora macrocephala]
MGLMGGRVRRGVCVFGLVGVVACGGQPVAAPVSSEPSPLALTLDAAERALEILPELRDAWRGVDCGKVDSLTAWAEGELGATVCAAVQNGLPGVDIPNYSEIEVFLPGDQEEGAWFAALARQPDPAYFVFAFEDGVWQLAYGPIPLLGKAPAEDAVPTGATDMIVKARLVPQQYLTYLTDPAGVSGVTFPAGDPVRTLLEELLRTPRKARPDRVSVDVRLATDASRALLLADGGALVFHAITLVFTQKPGAGRGALRHARYGSATVKAFTGKAKAGKLTGSEVLFLTTRVSKAGKMTTIGVRRELAHITAG